MLILTRKKGESLLIGDNIEITISEVEDGRVKLAIDAPKEIRILRKEVVDQTKEFNKSAMINKNDLINTLQNWNKQL